MAGAISGAVQLRQAEAGFCLRAVCDHGLLVCMREVTSTSFGLVIAYLIPGFVTLLGIGMISDTVQSWLTVESLQAPTVGGFLYGTLGSITAGLTVSTVRWATIDTLHHATGIPQSDWDFSRLQANVTAFAVLVEDLYRFYQFHSNLLIATAFTFVVYLINAGPPSVGEILAFALIEAILWTGSRDTLRRYYRQGTMLLGTSAERLAANGSLCDTATGREKSDIEFEDVKR